MTMPATKFLNDTPHIEGWLYPQAVVLTEMLLRAQSFLNVQGGCLEIGVYKGKYLAYLATSGRPCIGIDVFVFGQEAEAQRNIEQVVQSADSASTISLVQANTRALDHESFEKIIKPLQGLAFASIDGDHSAEGVAHDIGLVERALVPGGIIALDDVFSGMSPAVSEGFFNYMRGSTNLRAVAFADNKLFLTTVGYEALYQMRLAVDFAADPGTMGARWREYPPAITQPFLGGVVYCF